MGKGTRDIQFVYRAVDGFTKRASFKTLRGARRFAKEWGGPDRGEGWAVAFDGCSTLNWTGATEAELFPPEESDGDGPHPFYDQEPPERSMWVGPPEDPRPRPW